MRAFLAKNLLRTDDTRAVDQAVDLAERRHGLVDRSLGCNFLSDVGDAGACIDTQLLYLRL
jgi:hypothetical protein